MIIRLSVTFTMRVYAVWGRRRIILAYLVVLAVACIALDIVRLFFSCSTYADFFRTDTCPRFTMQRFHEYSNVSILPAIPPGTRDR